MKLTRQDRLILANQYEILKSLNPKNKDLYEKFIVILEHGFELHYPDFAQHIYDEDDILSISESREVMDILDMYWALASVYRSLGKKEAGVDKNDLVFPGFDGNSPLEGKYMTYVNYLVSWNKWQGVFFRSKDPYNSHSPVLDIYRRMLREWEISKDKHRLTKADIKRILDAKVHPSSRKNRFNQ